MARQLLPIVFLLLFAIAASPGWADDLESDYKLLKEIGLDPSAKGAAEFLRELTSNDSQRELIVQLIDNLGDRDFHIREEATRRLLRMPVAPTALLVEAAKSAPDLEIQWRAKWVLRRNETQSSRTLFSSLRIVAAEPGEVKLKTLFAALPFCQQEYVRRAAEEAILASATVNDLNTIRSQLTNESSAHRIAAAKCLLKVAPESEWEPVVAMLSDQDEAVGIQAASALADKGDRRVLGPLVELLGSKEATIRSSAAVMLRGLTGESIPFAAYEEAEKRSEMQAQWREWVTENGNSAKLSFPVARQLSGRGDLAGNTLVSTGSRGVVLELDPTGKQVWSYPIDAWSAEKLPNGNVLIGSYGNNKVIEVDSGGNVKWELTGVNAMNAKPLANGNYLIADFSGNRVMEVNPSKKTVWEVDTPENCFDCDRLPNGNTIAGCPNVIVEYAPDKSEVRRWKIAGRLNGFHALPSGNLLIANYGAGKVMELDADGKEVWSFAEAGPCDVFQLPTGKILVTTQSRVIELQADRKTVKQITTSNYGSARR
ncbi:MAG: PQQ-binding-like beta-propeller repeat protein [bacterium]|nr:PQQ-binding-like beta-propeller repeat protein [bacterium]